MRVMILFLAQNQWFAKKRRNQKKPISADVKN